VVRGDGHASVRHARSDPVHLVSRPGETARHRLSTPP
jgi:hypothetical protein